MAVQVEVKPFREISADGRLRINLHAGQTRAHKSTKRYVAVFAGAQSGKTAYLPHWLDREIRTKGPGDYLIGTSSFPLLTRKLLPEFLYVFKDLFHYGEYNSAEKVFTFWKKDSVKNPETDYVMFPDSTITTRVLIGSAQNPESMESATVLGVCLDECGMKMFKRETWEAIQRRTMINKARILMTTTLYGLGWLKSEIYDPWVNGDPDIDVIQFDSIENPAFPLSEYQRMKATMPGWKFDLFHRGRFSQPAGLIYDAFDAARDVIEPFEIPGHWPRYVGHDFGPNNTVALWVAQDPESGLFYVYRDYAKRGQSTFEHVTNWLELSKGERIAARVGGSPTEDGWRGDYTQAGWRMDKPLDGHVESGIQRVYGYEKLGKKRVFRNCQNYIAEKQSYSRELDDMYNATERIENKEIYHFMDAERYLFTLFKPLNVSTANTDTFPVWSY
jgi:hypothetical protein